MTDNQTDGSLQALKSLVAGSLQGVVGYRQTYRQTDMGTLTLYRALARVLMVADKGFLLVYNSAVWFAVAMLSVKSGRGCSISHSSLVSLRATVMPPPVKGCLQ